MIAVCTDYYPFVLQDLGPSPRTDGEWRELFTRMREINDGARLRRTLHVVVTLGDDPTVTERKIIARYMNESPAADEEQVVGSVVIASNSVTRGILTALQWLSPRFTNVHPVSSPDQGIDTGVRLLQRKGIAVSPSLINGAKGWFRAHQGARSLPT